MVTELQKRIRFRHNLHEMPSPTITFQRSKKRGDPSSSSPFIRTTPTNEHIGIEIIAGVPLEALSLYLDLISSPPQVDSVTTIHFILYFSVFDFVILLIVPPIPIQLDCRWLRRWFLRFPLHLGHPFSYRKLTRYSLRIRSNCCCCFWFGMDLQ